MKASSTVPKTVDDYISGFSQEVQVVLRRIREVVRAAAPDAQEAISYRMPAFLQNGVLLYFAAFRSHIGLYPPVRGDARIEEALARYAGEKGNLRFPLDEPIPYGLIGRIAKLRVKQNEARAAARRGKARARQRQTPGVLRDGAPCRVIGGTHAGKPGSVADIRTSKTGHVTITVVQANGERFKTLARNVVVLSGEA